MVHHIKRFTKINEHHSDHITIMNIIQQIIYDEFRAASHE